MWLAEFIKKKERKEHTKSNVERAIVCGDSFMMNFNEAFS